jgi:hypothetical protein
MEFQKGVPEKEAGSNFLTADNVLPDEWPSYSKNKCVASVHISHSKLNNNYFV